MKSQNGLILSFSMLTDIRSLLRSRGERKEISAIFAVREMISFAGQQNPTCGTTPVFEAFRWTQNLHEIRTLRRAGAFGTAVAKRFRVADYRSGPHYIQISLL
jgi:hypothetical protein